MHKRVNNFGIKKFIFHGNGSMVLYPDRPKMTREWEMLFVSNVQKCIYNPVDHLQWSALRKLFSQKRSIVDVPLDSKYASDTIVYKNASKKLTRGKNLNKYENQSNFNWNLEYSPMKNFRKMCDINFLVSETTCFKNHGIPVVLAWF